MGRSLEEVQDALDKLRDVLPDQIPFFNSQVKLADGKSYHIKTLLRDLRVDLEDYIPKRDARGRFIKKGSG